MGIGTRLSAYIEDVRGARLRIAMTWLEHLQTGEKLTPRTVETNLSRLLNEASPEHRRGLRFFFGHAKRAAALLDALGVGADERPSLLDEASASLEGAIPEVVVDLASFADVDFPSVLCWLETTVLPPTGRIIALVTATQEGALPRRLNDGVEAVVLQGTHGHALAALAGTSRLVISPIRSLPARRWVAVAVDHDGEFRMEPADWVRRWQEDGPLEDEPSPPAESPSDEPSKEVEALRAALASDPIATRRWLDELSGAIESDHERPDRLKVAQALGVMAHATLADRVEDHLGLTAQKVDAEEVERRVREASFMFTGPLLLRCGADLHVIHTDDCPAELVDSRLVWHRALPAPNPIEELSVELAQWSSDDWLDDPALSGLLSRLCPNEGEQAAYRYALLTLAWVNALPTPATTRPLEDWRPAVESLLGGAFAPADLVVFPGKEESPGYRSERNEVPSAVRGPRWPWRLSRAHGLRVGEALPGPSPTVDLLFPKVLNDALRSGGLERFRALQDSRRIPPERSQEEMRLLVPEFARSRRLPESGIDDSVDEDRDVETLDVPPNELRAWDRRRKRHDPPPLWEVLSFWRRRRSSYVRKLRVPLTGTLFRIPPVLEQAWLAADRWVAQLVPVLQRGLSQAVVVGAGEVLIPAGMVAARLVVRSHTPRLAPVAPWIALGFDQGLHDQESLEKPVFAGISRNGQPFVVHLPRSVHLGGAGVRVDVTFVEAPLLCGDALGGVLAG